MTTEQAWLVATTATASVLALVALLVGLRARARALRAEARADALAERVSLLEAPPTPAASTPPVLTDEAATFVITALHRDDAPPPVAREVDGRLFTDLVAREAVVSAASWTHGVRRALSAESRNRIRFEVRRETRRAGRERRAEVKQALREFRARERTAVRADEVGEDVA